MDLRITQHLIYKYNAAHSGFENQKSKTVAPQKGLI